ncbi:hypothetical protein ACIG56_33820 [Nocardia fusca]|uniref:hypothetical protein n=1 Tax=Nocardia fusca TaxID=941183 RepID=UPI0037C5C8E2
MEIEIAVYVESQSAHSHSFLRGIVDPYSSKGDRSLLNTTVSPVRPVVAALSLPLLRNRQELFSELVAVGGRDGTGANLGQAVSYNSEVWGDSQKSAIGAIRNARS